MTRHRRDHRRGYSLIELFVIMTVIAILMALCAGLIKLMLRLDQSSRDAMNLAADSARFARAFRLDAHRSADAEPPAPGVDRVGWALPDDERVEYTVRPATILREVRRPGKDPRRETFRLPPGATTRFEVAGSSGRSLLSVVIRRAASSKRPAVADRVDAEFARLARLTRRLP